MTKIFIKILSLVIFLSHIENLSAQNINNDSISDGKWVHYYKNGKIQIKAKFKNKKPAGKWTFYHKNGKISSKGKVLPEPWQKLYLNIVITGNEFIFNKKGKWKYYDEDGKLTSVYYYDKKGKLLKDIHYSPDGKITEKWDAETKEHIEYYKNGKIKKITKNQISTYFDENGNKLEKPKSQEFLDIIKSPKIVHQYMESGKEETLKNKNKFFEAYNIKDDEVNTKIYNDEMSKMFNFMEGEINRKMKIIYDELPEKELNEYIKIAREEPEIRKVLEETKYFDNIKSLLAEEFKTSETNLLLLIEKLKARQEPLKLRVIIDNDTIKNLNDLNLDLFLLTNKGKIKILDKKTGEIHIPENIDNKDMISIIVQYNNHEIVFCDRKSNMYEKFDKELIELLDPLSEDVYKDKILWELNIDHNPKDNKEAQEASVEDLSKYKMFIKFTTKGTAYRLL